MEDRGGWREAAPLATQEVHAGERYDPATGMFVSPIHPAVAFGHETLEDLVETAAGRRDRFHYTRYSNPDFRLAEEKLARLEGCADARVFASGMAAISAALLAHLQAGDRVAAYRDLYGGTWRLLTEVFPRYGIGTRFVDTGDEEGLARAARGARAVYVESPTNPLLREVDLARVAAIAHAAGALSLCDNTFATPVYQRPAEAGIDLVLHSGSKYLAGHSDLSIGAVCGGVEALRPVDSMRRALGGVPDPHGAWLLARSLKTLSLRMGRHTANARAVAALLRADPRVARVHYPGYSGMLSLELASGGPDAVARLCEGLRLFRLAPTLGGVESLVTVPRRTSHLTLSDEDAGRLGITDGLVRLSVGIEETADLLADLRRALGLALGKSS
ncbi:MAG: PLP-dependent transferase [Planctomycetes bacterium]|nr:PLP-dependent transferase [Planctomycetota bacterium]